jgi:hypothetical protein
MEYNTDRPRLIIPEYGRNVQKMIDYCMSIEDRAVRNEQAQSIIEVMGNLNPHLRDVPDFKHKLWDQMFIMSDFKLDVDSPYPIPSKETFIERPEMLAYPEKSKKYRFYGNNLKLMIVEAIKRDDDEEKEALIKVLANHMKKSYLNWNRDVVDDKTIFNHLYELSEGAIDLRDSDIKLSQSSDLLRKKPNNHSDNKHKNHHGQNRGHNNNYQNRGRK